MSKAINSNEKFVELYAEHRAAIFNSILVQLGRWADAEEVFQETSLILYREFSEFEFEPSFCAWACQIAHYVVLNFRRKQGRDKHVFSDAFVKQIAATQIAHSDDSVARREALLHCMDSLPSSDRSLVLSRYAGNTTVKKFAEDHGVSAKSLYRALDRIRRTLLLCVRKRISAGVSE